MVGLWAAVMEILKAEWWAILWADWTAELWGMMKVVSMVASSARKWVVLLAEYLDYLKADCWVK